MCSGSAGLKKPCKLFLLAHLCSPPPLNLQCFIYIVKKLKGTWKPTIFLRLDSVTHNPHLALTSVSYFAPNNVIFGSV